MFKRKNILISIANEAHITFLMTAKDGGSRKMAGWELESFLNADAAPIDLPAAALRANHRLLVVPDYWLGNSFQTFQARKKSIVTAFIERRLQLEHPTLQGITDFYNYTMVSGPNREQQLYTFYLQEPIAYDLYRRLEQVDLEPTHITTPALLWQAKLEDLAGPLFRESIGLVHLGETDCFLYFYIMGQFLFSRHIHLSTTDSDAEETYKLLNYEINQSSYLYSQKARRSLDALFLVGGEPEATERLRDLLGREVHHVPDTPQTVGLPEDAASPSCRSFTVTDLQKNAGPAITNKPLRNELSWRPVQWAGIAIGLLLAVLLSLECGYLHLVSKAVDGQMHRLRSAIAKPPEQLLEDVSLSLDEIIRELARPSGSGTVMRTILAMPEGVVLKNMSLQVSDSPHLSLEAEVAADHPDEFTALLKAFLNRLNRRFNLGAGPVREKDVDIQLERGEDDDQKTVYLIRLDFGIS